MSRTATSPYDPKDVATELRAIVGDDNVAVDAEELERISRSCLTERYTPQFAVFPDSSSQVTAIMQLANCYKLPVWPVSQGKNFGYGEKSACYAGGITIVLSRMNRIIEVNEALGYAVLEPGVTYGQLNYYLKKNHPTLWVDTAGSTTEASVIGNALDRGRGLTPYADHCAALCGMEVVLPDGSLIRTGGGLVEPYSSWNIYRWGIGPYMDGMFSQSNLGIVVKSGIWLMPQPDKFDFCVFEFNADSSKFPQFLDNFRALMFRGVIKSRPHIANDFAMLCIVDQYPKNLLKPGKNHLSSEDMRAWRKRLGVADWTFGCGFYGTKSEVREHKRIFKRTMKKYGEIVFVGGCEEETLKARLTLAAAKLILRLKGKSPKLLEGLPDAIRLFKGIPTDYFVRQSYLKSHPEKPPMGDVDPSRDGCGIIWIGPVLPFDAKQIIDFMGEVKQLYERFGFDFFVELMPESARCMFALFGLFYEKTNADECTRAKNLYAAIHELSYACGYPPYRTTLASTATLLDHNPPLKNALNQIKQSLDPNNVLAPGRYGVDPRR